MRPRSRDRVTVASGHSSARIAPARSSQDGSSGEKIAATATDRCRSPGSAARPGACRFHRTARSGGRRNRARLRASRPRRGPVRRDLRPITKRRQRAAAGNPMRIAATRASPCRCTTALTKWVVPITTASIAPRATAGCADSSPSAVTMPVVTSSVVGVLTAWTTRPSASRTASVLVPPTSIPIRRISHRHSSLVLGFASTISSCLPMAQSPLPAPGE